MASACASGGEESSVPTLGTTAPAADSTESDAGADSDTSSSTAPDSGDAPTTEAAEAAEEEPVAAGPEAPQENLFPDVDVVDLSSGDTINLASTLGGGDKATLLWFFAPH